MPTSKPKRGGRKTNLRRARKDSSEPETAMSTIADSHSTKMNSSTPTTSSREEAAAAAARGIAPPPSPPILTLSIQPDSPAGDADQPHPPPTTLSPASLTLTTKISTLQSQIASLEADLATTYAQLKAKPAKTQSIPTIPNFLTPLDRNPDPASDPAAKAEAITKRHIKLLHDYNEIKDVGLGLMGLIAEARGVRLGGVMEEFGVRGKD